MSSVRVRLWYALLISFIACVSVAVGSVVYSSVVQRRNDQRWCALLVQLTDAQRTTPPPTASGKMFAAELENLRREFHC